MSNRPSLISNRWDTRICNHCGRSRMCGCNCVHVRTGPHSSRSYCPARGANPLGTSKRSHRPNSRIDGNIHGDPPCIRSRPNRSCGHPLTRTPPDMYSRSCLRCLRNRENILRYFQDIRRCLGRLFYLLVIEDQQDIRSSKILWYSRNRDYKSEVPRRTRLHRRKYSRLPAARILRDNRNDSLRRFPRTCASNSDWWMFGSFLNPDRASILVDKRSRIHRWCLCIRGSSCVVKLDTRRCLHKLYCLCLFCIQKDSRIYRTNHPVCKDESRISENKDRCKHT